MPGPSTPQGTSWFSPWFWSCSGLLACFISGAWLFVAEASLATLEPVRLSLVWLGLLLTGIGVAQRFRVPQLSRLAKAAGLVLPLLALVFGSMTVAVSVVLVASWRGEYLIGVRPGLALILWLLVGPMSALAGWQCLHRRAAKAVLEKGHEAALSLLLASVVALVACFALASPHRDFSANWYTMQRCLFVFAMAALVAAPLTVVDGVTRRWVVSGLVTYHLLGIVTAAVGHPPSPWITSQIWMRLYRPYLEFLYLNNAYHFYSPQPGPSSYVWFRLYYTDSNGQQLGHWYKIPKLSDDGYHGHPVSLEYQRHLSIAENTMPTDPFLPEGVVFEKAAAKRMAWTPEAAKKDPIVGVNPPKHEVLVPLNPTIPKSQQYFMPKPHVKRLMETFARHVLHKKQAEFPDRQYTSVRIYRVVHQVISIQAYNLGYPPTDPESYSPVYMGEFDASGKLRDPSDALLYWQMPILRDQPGIGHSEIKDWRRRHAGDPYWRRVVENAAIMKWVDDNDKEAPD